jgi:hypothetical protein
MLKKVQATYLIEIAKPPIFFMVLTSSDYSMK